MIQRPWLLPGIFLAGLIILILPDKGNAIIRFNELHGPSFWDMIGLIIISISWLMGLIIIFKNSDIIKRKLGKGKILFLVSVYLLSCSAVVLALIIKNDSILWASVIVALIVNLLFIALAFTKRKQA